MVMMCLDMDILNKTVWLCILMLCQINTFFFSIAQVNTNNILKEDFYFDKLLDATVATMPPVDGSSLESQKQWLQSAKEM